MAFPSGDITVATVCDAYTVPRNMGALAGKTIYNSDGSIFGTVPSINITLNAFRGKYATSPSAPAGAGLWYAFASSADGSKVVTGYVGGFIYTSTDFGATWKARTDPGTGDWYAFASSADGTKLVTGKYGGFIYTSTNSGETWQIRNGAYPLSPGTGKWYGFASSADGTKLVTGNYNGGYIYTDRKSVV